MDIAGNIKEKPKGRKRGREEVMDKTNLEEHICPHCGKVVGLIVKRNFLDELLVRITTLKELVRKMALLFEDYFAFPTSREMFEKDVKEILADPAVKEILVEEVGYQVKEIKARVDGIYESPSGEIELIYIPDQTQLLQEGRAYRIKLDLKELLNPKVKSGRGAPDARKEDP
jgi:hypothetical protein